MSFGRAFVIATAAVLFLAVSFVVARWLTQDNRERDAVTDLLRAQARGDVAAMLGLLTDCAGDERCRRVVERNAHTLRRSGPVRIVRYDSSTAHALGDERGPTRVAWSGADDAEIVVQCIDVERRGLAFVDSDVVLASIGAPIDGEGSCPR